MVNIEKFICSLLNRASGLNVIKVIDILDALNNQGLDYKNGKIVRVTSELKESEDERIRKSLFEYFKNRKNDGDIDETWYGISYDEILAWFEKQGEQKPILDFNADDWYVSKVDGKIHNAKFVEQNPTYNNEQNYVWSEEDERIYNKICNIIRSDAFANYDVDEDGKECGEYIKILEWFKSLKEKYTNSRIMNK